MAFPGKQYGLIISQKAASKTTTLPRPSVFGDDSDEETSVGESLQKEARKKRMMKQTHLEMQKALEQDSSVYDYDGVYEDMQKQRLESSKKILGGTDRKPKYINQLMRAVEERKKEQERRDERKIQKERVAEGEQFADKEAYVTSAYRQKLKERQEEEEREKREAAIEAALDVKKQKDMSGFYRHLLNQTVGEEAVPDRSVPRSEDQVLKTVKIEAPSLPPPSPPSRDHAPSSHSDSEEGRDLQTGFSKPAPGAKRQYRQRSPSSGSGDEKVEKKDNKSHKNRERDRERDRGRERDHERDRERDRERDHDRDREGRRGGRRDEKDRRRERDEDRGRRDKERGERMGKREGSPKVREERDGEKEKKRAIDDKGTEREKERSGEKEKTTMRPDRRDEEKKDKEVEKEKRQEEKGEEKGEENEKRKEGEGEEKEGEEERVVGKFAKRSSEETVLSARDRYLARQIVRSACKTYIEKDED